MANPGRNSSRLSRGTTLTTNSVRLSRQDVQAPECGDRSGAFKVLQPDELYQFHSLLDGPEVASIRFIRYHAQALGGVKWSGASPEGITAPMERNLTKDELIRLDAKAS